MIVVNLSQENIKEVADVLCEAFYNYPVMKYVLGEKEDYDNRLRKMVTFFVSARALRKEPLLGIYNSENKLVAAAAVTLPGEIPSPPELLKLRYELWEEHWLRRKSPLRKLWKCCVQSASQRTASPFEYDWSKKCLPGKRISTSAHQRS